MRPLWSAIPLIQILLVLALNHVTVSGFLVVQNTCRAASFPPLRAALNKESKVDRLLELVHSSTNNNTEIKNLITSLNDQTNATEDNDIFTPLLGNYNVTYVIPDKPNEKPVGGKWSRKGPVPSLLSTRRTLQHLLPPKTKNSVAQAVNVISLSALRNLLCIMVILRGDAYALSDEERREIAQERQTPGGLSVRTVRADFDPPRIVVGGRLNMNLGPPSSVVLDTTYCDDRIRIGKGSKGSWFVFSRCHDVEADEWKKWIAQRPVKKSTIMGMLLGCIGVGLVGRRIGGLWRIGGITLSMVSLLLATVVGFSSGGIEQDDTTV